MAWTLDDNKPIYTQLVEILQMQVVSGLYPAGSKLPSVRELAAEAGVNPNTMQKAFAELEQGGLIITQRTSGRIVTEDKDLIKQTQSQLAKEYIVNFFNMMKELGYASKEIITLVEQISREEI